MNSFNCPRCGLSTSRPSLCFFCLEKDNNLQRGLAESHRLQAEAAAEQIAFERRRERDRIADRQRELEAGAAQKVDGLCEFAGTIGAEIQAAGSSLSAHTVLVARIANRLRTLDLDEWQFLHQVSPDVTIVAYARLRSVLVPYVRQLWPHRDRCDPPLTPFLKAITVALRFGDAKAFKTIPAQIAAAETEVQFEIDLAEDELQVLRLEKQKIQGWVTGVTRILPVASIALLLAAAVLGLENGWSRKPGDEVILFGACLFAMAGLAGLGLRWMFDPTRWRTQLEVVQIKMKAARKGIQHLQTKADAIPSVVVAQWTDPQLRPYLDSTP